MFCAGTSDDPLLGIATSSRQVFVAIGFKIKQLSGSEFSDIRVQTADGKTITELCLSYVAALVWHEQLNALLVADYRNRLLMLSPAMATTVDGWTAVALVPQSPLLLRVLCTLIRSGS